MFNWCIHVPAVSFEVRATHGQSTSTTINSIRKFGFDKIFGVCAQTHGCCFFTHKTHIYISKFYESLTSELFIRLFRQTRATINNEQRISIGKYNQLRKCFEFSKAKTLVSNLIFFFISFTKLFWAQIINIIFLMDLIMGPFQLNIRQLCFEFFFSHGILNFI